MTVLIATLIVTGVLLLTIALRPARAIGPGGRLFGFVAIGILPPLAAAMGLSFHIEHSKTTQFCLSCHPMEAYGRSITIDDVDHLPATHVVNGRVPRETACFECHTTYTMYGDYAAKLRGLQHVWVYYLGTVPNPVKLYSPYHNRECLHCHEGGRPFEEGKTHRLEEGRMEKIRKNEVSCLNTGCHPVVHDVASLDKLQFWNGPIKGGK